MVLDSDLGLKRFGVNLIGDVSLVYLWILVEDFVSLLDLLDEDEDVDGIE